MQVAQHKEGRAKLNIECRRRTAIIAICGFVVLAIYYFAWFSPHANECANSVTAFEGDIQSAEQIASNCNAEAAELYIATKILETETREAKTRAEVSKTALERLNTRE